MFWKWNMAKYRDNVRRRTRLSGWGSTGKVGATSEATPTTVKSSCICAVLQRQTATAVRIGHRRTVKHCTNRQTTNIRYPQDTQATHRLTSCDITNPRGLCAHPVLISLQSPPQLNIWITCFSVFRFKSLESLTLSISESQSLPTFGRHLKTFYFQSPYPLSAAHLA